MRSTFLQVMGVLLIIFGGVAFILNLVMIWTYLITGMGFLGTISVVRSALIVVAGIKAVTTYADRYRAAACVVWGAIVIVLAIVELIVALASSAWIRFSVEFFIIRLLVSLVLPVLYFIAAFRFARIK